MPPYYFFFFSRRRRHTRLVSDWSSDVCSSDLNPEGTKTTERKESETWNSERALLVGGGESFVGGAEERGGFVEDNGDRYIAEETLEFPFVLEGVEESTILHFFEDLDGDAAGNVNAAERKNFQRKISGFGAIDSGPKIQRVRADAARLVQPAAGDFRGRIGVGGFKRGVYNLRCEKLVEGAEAATGENEFPAYFRKTAAPEQ